MKTVARILVLDDEKDTEDLLTQKFRRQIMEGTYQFSFATQPKDAIEQLKQAPFDILITDINVAGMDGIAFISKLREDYPFMRTIVVSAYGDMNMLRAVMRGGAHDFVIKPIDFADLYATIEKTAKVVANLKQADATNKKLTAISDELDVSAKLQKSILPGNSLKRGAIELWADSIPAAEVGGDFYDFFWLNENQLGVVMADVSGKNVSAAMFALIAKTLIKSFAKIYSSPAECFRNVNNTLCGENATMMFVTAMYGIIDTAKNEMIYTNAGHLPMALISPSAEARFLECDSAMALGIQEDIEFENNIYHFSPGEMILMYTDGVPEAADRRGSEFDYERFKKVLNENSMSNPKMLTEALIRAIRDFTNGAAQSDDITTLCLKYRLRVMPHVS